MQEQERSALGVEEDAPEARRRLATLRQLRAIDAPYTRGRLDYAAPRTLNARSADEVASFDYDAARDSLVAGSVRKTAPGRRKQALAPDRLPLANGGGRGTRSIGGRNVAAWLCAP